MSIVSIRELRDANLSSVLPAITSGRISEAKREARGQNEENLISEHITIPGLAAGFIYELQHNMKFISHV